MLATGGLLGLLLMGAAVGGLVTGMDTGRDASDDDDRPDGADEPGVERIAADEDAPIDMADWLNAFDAEDAAHSGSGAGESSLARLLFGHASPAGDGAADDDDRLFALMQSFRTGSEISGAPLTPVDASVPVDPILAAMSGGAAASAVHLDVVDTIDLGPLSGIPHVTDFDAATDRLILDFPGTASEAPTIDVDLDTSPGDALVLADGVPVTLVAGAATLTPSLIDVVMTGPTETAEAASGAERSGAIGTYEALGVIEGFNPSTHQIEIDYDPAVFAEPEVAIRAAEDGSGADILLNGERILSVAGAPDLDPDLVVLRPV
jgi:hypothetical protein